MIDLIDRMREIIERHRVAGFTARHVAQEIVARLGLRAEACQRQGRDPLCECMVRR
jgi:hypothetical protein